MKFRLVRNTGMHGSTLTLLQFIAGTDHVLVNGRCRVVFSNFRKQEYSKQNAPFGALLLYTDLY